MKEKNILQRTPVVCILAIFCCALWGSAFPCIKLGYAWMNISSSDTATQILYAGCRFTLAGLLTILLGCIGEKRLLIPPRKAFPKIAWLSLLQTIIQYLFFYIGLAHTTGVKGSIVTGTNTFIAILFACLIFHQEEMTMSKVIGCILGFSGVILVNLTGSGLSGGFAWNGEGFIFVAAMSYAASSVYLKRFSKEYSPVLLSGYQFVFGGIVMILCSLIFGGHLNTFTTKAVLMLLWLAFVSAVAYTLWGILLKHNPVSKVTIFGFSNPIFGTILSAIFLNEKDSLNIMSIFALAFVSAGIFIVNRKQA